MSNSTTINSKRFVLRQSLVGQNATINVVFKNGRQVTYSHDKAFEVMKATLETMNCWAKYKSYTASTNIPKVLRETDAVIENIAPVKVEEETQD